MSQSNLPIDLVYTWVNGEDPAYIEIWKQYAENPRDVNPERYRDTYQLLKYSFRSIEKFLEGYRNIYIVTARAQVPAWLDVNHPKVHIVHHDEIIDPEFLPTFNPNCIETFFHNIPGISDHFLYINDDFLFGSPTTMEDFMPGGKHLIYNTFFGENLSWRVHDGKNDIVGAGIIEHTPMLIRKDFWKNMTELYPEKQYEIRSNKFRKRSDFMTYKLYRYYMLKYQKELSKAIHIFDLLKVNTFHKIMNKLPYQQRALAKIERKKPKYYCLNDDMRDNPNPAVIELVRDFLARYYPEKSSFEI